MDQYLQLSDNLLFVVFVLNGRRCDHGRSGGGSRGVGRGAPQLHQSFRQLAIVLHLEETGACYRTTSPCIIKTTNQSDSSACEPTFRLLVVTMTSPVRLVVRPCADGKLRRGGGGGGDLEGFSVRYFATLRSTENREGWLRTS